MTALREMIEKLLEAVVAKQQNESLEDRKQASLNRNLARQAVFPSEGAQFAIGDDDYSGPFGRHLNRAEADAYAERMVNGKAGEPVVLMEGWDLDAHVASVPANGKIPASAQRQADKMLKAAGYGNCIPN